MIVATSQNGKHPNFLFCSHPDSEVTMNTFALISVMTYHSEMGPNTANTQTHLYLIYIQINCLC